MSFIRIGLRFLNMYTHWRYYSQSNGKLLTSSVRYKILFMSLVRILKYVHIYMVQYIVKRKTTRQHCPKDTQFFSSVQIGPNCENKFLPNASSIHTMRNVCKLAYPTTGRVESRTVDWLRLRVHAYIQCISQLNWPILLVASRTVYSSTSYVYGYMVCLFLDTIQIRIANDFETNTYLSSQKVNSLIYFLQQIS